MPNHEHHYSVTFFSHVLLDIGSAVLYMIPSVQSTFLYRREIPSRHSHLSLMYHLFIEAIIRSMVRHLIFLLDSYKLLGRSGMAETLGVAYTIAYDF